MIVFVDYKYKGIGGVGQLVFNTVLELNRKGKTAKIYASADSYEYKRLKQENADFIFINSDKVGLRELSSYIEIDDVIVLTNLSNNDLLNALKIKNNRLLFYVVHPDTFFSTKVFHCFFKYNQRSIELVELLSQKNALCIMDRPNVEAIERKGGILRKPVVYLPVPIRADINDRRYGEKLPNGNKITYIGRGNDDWKIYPVIKVLQDLNRLDRNYTFVICTDSEYRFKELIAKHLPQNAVTIDFKVGLFGHELDKYLLENSWLHISMGTSALEGAKLGIPTILIDYSKSLFPENYVYKWLFESKGYSLADELHPETPVEGKPLIEMINLIQDPASYQRISDSCYNYLVENHSISSFVDRMIDYCEKSEMTIQDYSKTSIAHFYNKLYPYYYKYLVMRYVVNHPIGAIKKAILKICDKT